MPGPVHQLNPEQGLLTGEAPRQVFEIAQRTAQPALAYPGIPLADMLRQEDFRILVSGSCQDPATIERCQQFRKLFPARAQLVGVQCNIEDPFARNLRRRGSERVELWHPKVLVEKGTSRHLPGHAAGPSRLDSRPLR
jgi:hypothetical protein